MQVHEDFEQDDSETLTPAPLVPALKFQSWLGYSSLDHLWLALLGLAALAAAILGWNLIQQALRDSPPAASSIVKMPAAGASQIPDQQSAAELAARAEMRQKIEAQLAQSSDYMRFFERLKLVYPTEYETIMDTFARQAVSAGETGSIDAMMSEAVRALRVSHGVLATRANGPALQKIFTMQLAMMQALAGKDQRLCVDFLYGGASRGFFQFSSANRALVADMALAGLDAISDGQTSKIERAAPNGADFQMLEKALRDQGLSTPEIEALLDGKTADPPISDARMCTAGEIYLRTLAALPDDARDRLYGLAVELMARS